MRVLYVDEQHSHGIAQAAWDILVARAIASYKPDAIAEITEDGQIPWLMEHAEPGRLLTTLDGRDYYSVLPEIIEVLPWNARPANKIELLAWALMVCGIPRDKAREIAKSGKVAPTRGKYAEATRNAVEWLGHLQHEEIPFEILEKEKQLPLFYGREKDLALSQLMGWAGEGTPVSFDIETTGLDPQTDRLVGISFSDTPGRACYIDLQGGVPSIVRAVLAHPAIPKVTHNGKFDYKFLTAKGVTVENLAHDTQVLAYLLQLPSLKLKDLGEQLLDYRVVHFNDIVPEGTTFDQVEESIATKYGCQDADLTLRLYEMLSARVKGEGRLWDVYQDIEMPLVPILAHMELAGAEVDLEEARHMLDDLEREVASIENSMWTLAGQKFDPNSAKDLSFLLYEKLGLQPLKETKSGMSTDKFTLERLEDEHVLVKLILEWRSRTKLIGTYLRPLLAVGRNIVHGQFNQTVTSTGRLSSSGPNLQNQPPRARTIYHVPEGKLLIAADYSQQELRLLTHCSQEPAWVTAYTNHEDLHAGTAALLHIPRKTAKIVNFGIAYGAGPDVIARNAKCSRTEAVAILEAHHKNYPRLWEWIQETKDAAHRTGYAESLWGRRRYIPKIFTSFPEERQAAEREAVNMVIQGSAADITKMAMKRTTEALGDYLSVCRLILQVHDELVFELEEEDLRDVVVPIIEGAMTSVDDGFLSVPMFVEAKTGHRWSELK